jgi:hypothetical protein
LNFPGGWGRIDDQLHVFAENPDEDISCFGEQALSLLQQLFHFANSLMGPGKWKNFCSHFMLLPILHETAANESGNLARSLAAEMDSLWTFLD